MVSVFSTLHIPPTLLLSANVDAGQGPCHMRLPAPAFFHPQNNEPNKLLPFANYPVPDILS